MYNWFWGTTRPQNAIALQDSLNSFYNNSTHWWKQNYQVAKVLNANLQASGGNENVRYMIGAGYYDEEGIAVNTGFTRFNVLTNLTAMPAKKLQDGRPIFTDLQRPESWKQCRKQCQQDGKHYFRPDGYADAASRWRGGGADDAPTVE